MGQGMLQTAIGTLSGLMMLAALFLLWWKSKSPWLLGALLAEGLGFVMRIVVTVAPMVMSELPLLGIVWTGAYLLMALGLLGYALTETMQRDAQ